MVSQAKVSRIPSYLIGGELFTGAVQVISEPELVMERGQEAKPKSSASFPGRQAYSCRVEAQQGTETKKLPSGKEITYPVFAQVKVTFWLDQVPSVEIGSYVRLLAPMVGAVDGSVYVQALGMQKIEAQEQQGGEAK